MDVKDSNKAWEHKVERKIERYIREYRMRIKDEEEREFLEEVFDKGTLMALYHLMNEGYIDELYGVVATGKEARVYGGKDRNGNPIAVKIFLTLTSDFKKGRYVYIKGDPRFKGISKAPIKLIHAWTSKEYKNLLKAYEAGVYVPRPIVHYKNILVMEFIGKDFVPAPLLKELPSLSPYIFKQVLNQVGKLYVKAELIHADLSEYNIFYFKRKPILFDFGQAVLKTHPLSEQFLVRDVSNIVNFFKSRGVDIGITVEEAVEYVKNYRQW